MADQQEYGNAYDESDNYGQSNTQSGGGNYQIDMQTVNKVVPQEQQKQIATQVGQQVASNAANAVQDDYNQNKANQSDPQQNQQNQQNQCEKCWNWFPLRYFSFIGGLAYITTAILDIVINRPNFVSFVILLYLVAFGIIIAFVESPTWKCTRKIQLGIYFWFRLLSRSWGRASFYIFISFLAFSQININGKFAWVVLAGSWMICIAVLMYIFAGTAARKYNDMYNHMVQGEEGDAAAAKIMRCFDVLDKDQDGCIGSLEIHKLGDEAGRHLSNAERHAIQTFLDESCNGHISKEDWMKQWLTFNPYAQKIRFV